MRRGGIPERVTRTGASDVAVELSAGADSSSPESGSLGVVTPSSQALSAQHEKLAGIEDDILRTSMETVQDAMFWQDVFPVGESEAPAGPPQQWVDELGEERARRRFRVAMAACMNAKDAPVGLGMARATFMGITKVRAASKVGSPTLAIQFVNFPQPQLEIMDIEAEEK